jgi:hypothetical protein
MAASVRNGQSYTVTADAFSTGCFAGAIATSTIPTIANTTTALFAVAKN